MDTSEFSFAFETRYARAGRVFRINPKTTGITVTGERLIVRFGPWRVQTALENIASIEVTGPFAFLKTAGPARLGLTDLGLTFATNHCAGVCVAFRESVGGLDAFGLIRHPNLTVTPADVSGLVASLASAAKA